MAPKITQNSTKRLKLPELQRETATHTDLQYLLIEYLCYKSLAPVERPSAPFEAFSLFVEGVLKFSRPKNWNKGICNPKRGNMNPDGGV